MSLTNAFRERLTSLERRLDRLEQRAVSTSVRHWTPELTSDGTSPSLGTGYTADGLYVFLPGYCAFQCNIVFGTGSSAGTGNYEIAGLPLTPYPRLTGLTYLSDGGARLFDSSGSVRARVGVLVTDDSKIQLRGTATFPTGANYVVGAAVPWAWGDGDRIEVSGGYFVG